MKWQQLFNNLKEYLLYTPNINITTTNKLLTIFIKSISDTNKERFKTEIDYILSYTSKQLSLTESLNRIKTNELEKELNNQLLKTFSTKKKGDKNNNIKPK
jgi:Fic family protein